MGLLVEGRWQDKWYDTDKNGGKFKRQESQFRHTVSDNGPFRPESDRYHLFLSLACPWAHRALILRKLKGLEAHIDISIVSPDMLENGWEFSDYPGSTGDKLYGLDYMHQLYTKAKPDYTGRVTVPVLWDKARQTIVNNESSEIVRIFNSDFNTLTDNKLDFYPAELQPAIDKVNDWVYHRINNGVYKTGFATTQEAYEEAFGELFEGLDYVEQILAEQRYLVKGQLTEADWRLFTTLVRFDPVYVGHFKCNRQRIADYPNLSNYLRELYQHPGIAETVNLDQIKRHYYYSHTMINPTQVIPKGPELDWQRPHNRADKPI
ncbi:Glutathione S-transferase omega-like [Saliniradius amylolyticus]|uniref:Glutathione S-transferase omega-like n=1 Tax=Saliniradius amylolyticus TaxID=2183582 RepID=A0A2S2E334_9ALTE|nr:glutathione S-transferase family protein [Saliniradius amylolyticus]AWL12058.1 Glutathione S-transferase omega-like [Saliniradius amylolyticus]